MNTNTYHKSGIYTAILDILILTATKAEGFTVSEIAGELSLKEATVRNYLSAIISKKLIEKQGERYITGQAAAQLWSRRIAHLKSKSQTIQKNLDELEV